MIKIPSTKKKISFRGRSHMCDHWVILLLELGFSCLLVTPKAQGYIYMEKKKSKIICKR